MTLRRRHVTIIRCHHHQKRILISIFNTQKRKVWNKTLKMWKEKNVFLTKWKVLLECSLLRSSILVFFFLISDISYIIKVLELSTALFVKIYRPLAMFFHVFTSHGQIASLECYSIFRLSCAIISSTHENLKCLGKSWFAFSFKTQFFCRLRDLQNLFLLDPRLLNAILHIWKQFFFRKKTSANIPVDVERQF